MEFIFLTIALAVLLAINGFFVLAEFAIVKVRSTRIAELVAAGDTRARALAMICENMDDYLGVCQVGITLASVALGMVGKRLSDIMFPGQEHDLWRTLAAILISYIVISGSHIVLGEQVPKMIAIKWADRCGLLLAKPLRICYLLFYPTLWMLTASTNGILRLFGLYGSAHDEQHSEDEVRIILDRSQERGMMSFRRLLFIENVFDFGTLTVRDAMRLRSAIKCLDARQPWANNLKLIRETHYTRFPLLDGDADLPVGLVHVKDIVLRNLRNDADVPDLRALTRPIITMAETTPIEVMLAEMQRRAIHAALVTNAEDKWVGFVTLEDVLEEIVGTIRDEFEDEELLRLGDILKPERIFLQVDGVSSIEAVRSILIKMPPAALPIPLPQFITALQERERLVSTYLGEGIGMPHARVNGLSAPYVMLLRSTNGVPFEHTAEKAHLLFVLLTPAGQPRIHQRIQSRIASLLHESDFVKERLLTATTVEEVMEVIRTGEQAALG